MEAALKALGDPTVRGWYLIFCMALLVLPMIALSYWYHSRINRSSGGRQLMKRQNRTPARPTRSLSQAARGMTDAADLARDIAAGKYGEVARRMQNKVYLFCGLWLLANTIAFGILFWADEVNRIAT
ncbi:MAG TPA: hypothetical protein VMX97_13085 [Hyphomicrobiaceae bacterium]|nr:hypothetical protein [Hyphomicrobiaceae bacterium]